MSPGSNSNVKLEDISEETKSHKEAFSVVSKTIFAKFYNLHRHKYESCCSLKETCGKDVSILPENPKRAVTEETEAEKVIKTELSVMVGKINIIHCGNISPSQLFKQETCSENETLQEKPEEQNSGCSTIEPESVKPGSNSNEKLQDVSEETESQKEAFFVVSKTIFAKLDNFPQTRVLLFFEGNMRE